MIRVYKGKGVCTILFIRKFTCMPHDYSLSKADRFRIIVFRQGFRNTAYSLREKPVKQATVRKKYPA